MKNKEKRKIVSSVIIVLCIAVAAGVFLMLRSWLHSDGMHFIGSYGQIHISQMCEGIDQDGNKMKSRNVVVDGEITRMVADGEITQNRKFTGTIDIDDLPELDKVMPAGPPMT